jgi:transcriptional regulator with GAF, ATPase, and Fis domain
MTRDEAIKFIMGGSGTMYDPRVVGTFITHLPEFEAEILAHRDDPVPTFGIEPEEQLSETARLVAPAAGLAEPAEQKDAQREFSHRETKSLYEMARAIIAADTRDKAVNVLMEKLAVMVGYDCCVVTLEDAVSGEFVVTHADGSNGPLLIGRKTAIGEGVTGWVLANQKPFCNTDPKLDLAPALAGKFAGFKTLAVYPILKDSRTIGTLGLYSAQLSEYGPEKQALLGEAAELIGNAIASSSQVRNGFTVQQPTVSDATYKAPLMSEAIQ